MSSDAGRGVRTRVQPERTERVGALEAMPIWAKLTLLTLTGLVSLVGSTFYLSSALQQTADRTDRMKDLFDVVEVAGAAHVDFGDMRYWLTDLAVSLLVASERRAEQARGRLDTHLDRLAAYDDAAVSAIRAEVDAYVDKAIQAVDAYTDDNRVIGNTLLAAARSHSTQVDEALNALVGTVNAAATAERRNVVDEAAASARTALYIVIALTILGLILTTIVLRSIVQPLARLKEAIAGLTQGRYDIDLPPSGRGELGAVARTLELFRETAIERSQLEADAERQRMRIATAIETIPDGFVLYDADDRVLLANSRYREIFPDAAAVAQPGASFREILQAQLEGGRVDLDGMSAESWIETRLARHRESKGYVDEVRRAGGWVRISKRETPEGGKVAVYTDITELKQRQDELEEARRAAEGASEAKSQFLASMSHELRTPLNAIIGYSEMLMEEASDLEQDAFIPDLDKIAGSGRHLLMLINDILDLSKIEAGKMEVFVETFDLAGLIGEVAATVEPLMGKKSNDLQVKLGAELGEMRSDQTKIRQNLFNLLSNAAKFTENGEIGLSVQRQFSPDGDRVVFEVSDNGIGMTEVERGKLFEAFTQADASTTRNYGGTGLGLNITRSFCQMIGGKIEVASTPGVGSTFTMTLPAICPQPLTPTEDDPVSESGLPSEYVLVIDDEPAARRIIGQALDQVGIAYREAADGTEGIRMVRRARPLAIVLDIIMPRQDGWSVLRTLKSDPEFCDIPVILATVMADRDFGLALGAVDHLSKPIDTERLISTLEGFRSGDGKSEVLVIDDDRVSRDLLRRTLVKQGWSVHEAADGLRGLEQIRNLKPRVVILDLMMPEMDGFEVLTEMQSVPELTDTRVIVLTAKDLSGAEKTWLREHAGAVVAKGAGARGDLVAALQRQIPRPVEPTE